MSQDEPGLTELLRTVREFLEKVTDELEDQDRYHALCASYLLSIAERELALGEAIDHAEQARLTAFLGQSLALPDGYRRLAADIRAGSCDARWDEAVQLVLAHVVDKVRVSKPEYLDPLHRGADGA